MGEIIVDTAIVDDVVVIVVVVIINVATAVVVGIDTERLREAIVLL